MTKKHISKPSKRGLRGKIKRVRVLASPTETTRPQGSAFWPFFLSRFPLGHEEGRQVSRKPNPKTKLKIHEVCWIWFPPVIMSVYNERVSSHTMNRARDKRNGRHRRRLVVIRGPCIWMLWRGDRVRISARFRGSPNESERACARCAQKRETTFSVQDCICHALVCHVSTSQIPSTLCSLILPSFLVDSLLAYLSTRTRCPPNLDSTFGRLAHTPPANYQLPVYYRVTSIPCFATPS
jgi:hypothetical protein